MSSKETPLRESKGARAQARKELFEALASLSSVLECEWFLEDLCTPDEIESMADRLQVARLVSQNIPYRTISEQTGVSTATITRVARCFTQGRGGYELVLKRKEETPC